MEHNRLLISLRWVEGVLAPHHTNELRGPVTGALMGEWGDALGFWMDVCML